MCQKGIPGFTHMCVVKDGVRGVDAGAHVDIDDLLLAVDGHGASDIVADGIVQHKGTTTPNAFNVYAHVNTKSLKNPVFLGFGIYCILEQSEEALEMERGTYIIIKSPTEMDILTNLFIFLSDESKRRRSSGSDKPEHSKLVVVIASLLGVFLAPALANLNMENNFNGQPSENSIHSEIRVSTNPRDGSEPWKTIWDFEAGYVATKVFSKNTCIIATTSKRFWLGKAFPTPPPGDKLPPRENRFIISRNRLQSLSPYGKRIQALCRGIPSYLAYPAPGESAADGPGAPKCAQVDRSTKDSSKHEHVTD
ncbi:hypothetical protein EK904_002294 [Melospiza melodia maxima]|nr:hypothetical protein EK904_002294 [Melospiza melodia maxima]